MGAGGECRAPCCSIDKGPQQVLADTSVLGRTGCRVFSSLFCGFSFCVWRHTFTHSVMETWEPTVESAFVNLHTHMAYSMKEVSWAMAVCSLGHLD